MERGQIIGQIYQIIEEIGQGGAGIIYKAYHIRLKKYVIIKKFKDCYVDSVNTRLEADILKKLHHTCLPQVYDFIEQERQVFTVMEYIDGNDLGYYMKKKIYFPQSQLVIWLRELCDVLDYLHSQSPPILHSDIKPENIMLSKKGQIYLIDFNISLGLEDAKDILGISPNYAAPEQFYRAEYYQKTGEISSVLDGRMDLYSLGATFYALVSGVIPSTNYPTNIPLKNMDLPNFSDAFLFVIDKSMRIKSEERYATAKEMHTALMNLRKLDSRYRRLRLGQVAVTTGYAVMFMLSVGIILHGIQTQKREHFQKDYNVFYQAVQQKDEQKILDQGLYILNQKFYKNLLEKQTEEKAAIFHEIGNYYYEKEDYQNACIYYKKSTEVSIKADYYRDYAISLAKSGDIAGAESVLIQAEKIGFYPAEISYIRAEIAYKEQEYEKAESEISMVFEQKPEENLKIRAYLLKADIAEKLEKTSEQISYLEEAQKLGGQTQVLRKLGAAYVAAAGKEQGQTASEKYYNKALKIYINLASLPYPSVEDRINLAIVYLQLGKTYHCENTLLALTTEGITDYRVWMYLTFAYEQDQDTAQMKSCCQEAVKSYEASGSPVLEETIRRQMEHLYEIYKRVGGKI